MESTAVGIISFKNSTCKHCKYARFSGISPLINNQVNINTRPPVLAAYINIYCDYSNQHYQQLTVEDITLKHISKCKMLNYYKSDGIAQYRKQNHISYK